MKKTLIQNALLINEGKQFYASVLIEGEFIRKIYSENEEISTENCELIDASGLYLIPGVIDDHVHFREPGLTHKADIQSESKAAVAGGVTSFMEMPNTVPQAVTIDLLEEKYKLGAEKSLANYSFYIAATNNNLSELKKVDKKNVCGIKLFMGSSTGNMLVDNQNALNDIFSETVLLIAAHCEDESIIQKNTNHYKSLLGNKASANYHPLIRTAEACYQSTLKAVELADKYNSRLHVLHLSTEKELCLFPNDIPLSQKRITAEVCVHHLWFTDEDYEKYGNNIKWNPSIKSEKDRNALRIALNNNKLDIVASDHAPHLQNEKQGSVFEAASGAPLVQHSLSAMLQMAKNGVFSFEKVIEKMCHAPADLFKIEKRGYIREGYYADLVLIDPNKSWKVEKDNILYKCAWSPFAHTQFDFCVQTTFVNGNKVYDDGKFDDSFRGKRLTFNN